ncbi:MAG: 50S ribosomal protein L25 [Deferribacterales bacterium]|jgi:large subunit ribosomal protein L25
MIETIKWEGTKRKPMTQGEMKAMRKSGLVPAIISRRGEESVEVFLNAMDIEKRPFGNFRIELKVKGIGEPFDCFLKTLQYSYNRTSVVHADLQGLVVGQELDIDIAIELIGDAPGVKEGGILNTGVTSLKIRTLPKNMPSSIQVDISKLKIGESINVTDIKLADVHTLIDPTEGNIVSIAEPRGTSDDADTDTEMTEPEIISEKSDD